MLLSILIFEYFQQDVNLIVLLTTRRSNVANRCAQRLELEICMFNFILPPCFGIVAVLFQPALRNRRLFSSAHSTLHSPMSSHHEPMQLELSSLYLTAAATDLSPQISSMPQSPAVMLLAARSLDYSCDLGREWQFSRLYDTQDESYICTRFGR